MSYCYLKVGPPIADDVNATETMILVQDYKFKVPVLENVTFLWCQPRYLIIVFHLL